MMNELYYADHAQVRPLFQPLAEYLPFCNAVLQGRQSGRVFVDDTVRPRTAFMITREMWCYLAGDPLNEAFNRPPSSPLAGLVSAYPWPRSDAPCLCA